MTNTKKITYTYKKHTYTIKDKKRQKHTENKRMRDTQTKIHKGTSIFSRVFTHNQKSTNTESRIQK